jgi:integrase
MKLDRVDSRHKLKVRRDPYWQRLSQGRYVGFRLMSKGSIGTWLARFYDGAKYQQRPLGEFAGLDERERFDVAKREAEAWFAHMDVGGATKPGTVKAACQDYVEHLKTERSQAVAKDAEKRFGRLVYGCSTQGRTYPPDPIARVDLAKLAPHHVESWRKRVIPTGSGASFNRNATALRAALNYAKKRGKVPTDAAWAEFLKPIADAGEPRTLYLDREKRRALIEAATDEARPFFVSLALNPFRPGEVAKLKVEHLDAVHALLHIPIDKTKARDVPLSAEGLAHFKACAKDKLPSAWLVARADGSQWKKEAWRDEIKLAAATAKLPRAVVANTLRHSVITDLVTGGLDLFTVAKLAGTSVVMIEKTYGKLRADHARAALQGLSLKDRAAR